MTNTDGTTITYKYDVDGIRTSKTVNGVTTKYTTINGKITSQTDGTNSLYFYYDSNDEPFSVDINGTSYIYVKNIQGDIIAITDVSGTIVVRYTYDAWGNATSITGSLASTIGQLNPMRYRGYYYDTETGYYYLQSRYYEPAMDRFINSDELSVLALGYSYGNNMFSYCNNNPIMYADPSGYLTIRADYLSYALDIIFTAIGSWFKLGYDIVGLGLEAIAKKQGVTLFYEKLIKVEVPKIKGLFGKGFTLIRKAMYRATGISASFITTTYFSKSLNYVVNYISRNIKNGNISKVWDIIFSLTSLGGAVALFLDYTSDWSINNKIKI